MVCGYDPNKNLLFYKDPALKSGKLLFVTLFMIFLANYLYVFYLLS